MEPPKPDGTKWVQLHVTKAGRAAALMVDFASSLFGEIGDVVPAATVKAAEILAALKHMVGLFAATSKTLLTKELGTFRKGLKDYVADMCALVHVHARMFGPHASTCSMLYRLHAVPQLLAWCDSKNIVPAELV